MSSNTNATQQLEGKVDKNTFVRWILTTDEPWTALVDTRRIVPKAQHVHVHFKNELGVSIDIIEKDDYDITNTRRMLIDAGERQVNPGYESECNICLTSPECSIESVRLKCGQCTFTMCSPCQRQIVEKKGYLQCPVCKKYMWGQDWFVSMINDGVIDSDFECPPNNVFIMHFDETMALQRWKKIRRSLEGCMGEFKGIPANKVGAFIDFAMAQAYDDMVKMVINMKKAITSETQLREDIERIARLYTIFKLKTKPPVRFRPPEPERFEPKDMNDVMNLAQRILNIQLYFDSDYE
jgi:hypothetical protein